ncbi:MAG: hypothetical protein GXP04_14365 [Alphaproteobacteria bacterium]|nr:hypothetical protein [Alphaproteobacteria bacterium]
MKQLCAVACLLCALLLTPAALAGESILDRFSGEWASSGPAFGMPAQSAMGWAPALGNKFTRLNYRIEMMTEAGPESTFEGVAYYRASEDETFNAFWADNTGDLHPISATHEGDALISLWGVEGGKQGRTRYELFGKNEMQVTDWIKTPDGWRLFNQNIFLRVLAKTE